MTSPRIRCKQGDITQASEDAIVNAANPVMLGGGGVDGAIHRAAGPQLLEACRQVKAVNGIRCPVGQARITKAGALAAQFVIHTVGPRYGIDQPSDELLASAYRESLVLACHHHCRSVALPAISCGVYGYPLDEAASIAIEVCHDEAFSNLAITFYLFGQATFAVFQKALTHHG